jgi:hypothetical protein
MPPRPKHNKRRTAAGLDEWSEVFETEFDMFGDLCDAGIDIDASGRPSRETAQAAWQLHGEAFLAEFAAKYPRGAHFVPWALREFGNP